jgi:RHS repeat-associated protein
MGKMGKLNILMAKEIGEAMAPQLHGWTSDRKILKYGYDERPVVMTIGNACSSAQRPGFFGNSTGKERDVESGLDYFGARYYSGAEGKWVSPDPRYFQKVMVVDPQQFNLYSYARNNPLRWVDPFGENLYLDGDTDWLRTDVLYVIAGGMDAFNKAFTIKDNQVVTNEGIDKSSLNSGQALIFDLVDSYADFLFFAGIDGKKEARLFKGMLKKNGKLNEWGEIVAAHFGCVDLESGCGYDYATSGRLSKQPIDPYYSIIALNKRVLETQDGPSNYNDPQKLDR